MGKITGTTIFLLLAVSLLKAAGQPVEAPGAGPVPYYYFSQYQVTGGLLSNSVFCVAQDHYGFLWVGTGNGVCRYDGYHFTTVYNEEECQPMAGLTESVMVDNEGLVWFSTLSGKGWYDPVTGKVTTLDIDTDSPVTSIVQDNVGNIWFCSSDLYKYSKEKSEITKYPSGRYEFVHAASDSEGLVWCTCSDGRLLAYNSIVDKFEEEDISNLSLIARASNRRLIASTLDDKVVVFNPLDGSYTVILESLSRSGNMDITSLLERVPGEFWIGTNYGVYIFFEETGRTLSVTHSDSERMSLSSDDVQCLSTDREGNVWVGTLFSGLNLWRNIENAYMFFYPIPQKQSISGTLVRALNGSGNRLYAGTEDGELNYLQPDDASFDHIDLPGYRNNYRDILIVGDELWICTYGNGIFRYNQKSSSVINHYRFGSNQFHHIIQTSEGTILVSSTNGMFRYVNESDEFMLIPKTEGSDILDLLEDSTGRIWAGTYGKGIILLDQSFNITENLQPGIRVTSLFEDSRHMVWVTTEGDAVFTVDVENLQTEHLSLKKGFPSSVTCSIVEDSEGMIWISTNRGLHLLDPTDFRVVSSFFRDKGEHQCQFAYGAAYGAGSDYIAMGTSYGLLTFVPSKMKSIEMDKSIYISSIKGIKEDRLTGLCEDGVSSLQTKRILASYKDVESLRIRFSCLNFASPASFQYQYTLSSPHGSVSEVTSECRAVIPHVGYGKHVFTVSLLGSDAPESTKSVEIIIRPPFYKSAFARIMMLLVTMSLLGYFVLNIVRWRRKERMMRQERIEKEKQRELYESKNAFFMNVAHEIRTPLSLIKMPLDNMIRTGEYSLKDLEVIQANTDRLLNLANQLLDIRKYEQNEKKLEFTPCNLSEIVRRTVGLFSNMAEEQGIQLAVSVPTPVMDVMCAGDSVEKIISNLISNAFKYGGDRIDVALETSGENAIIRVDSNGDRIPSKNSERIFDKFITGGKGAGLGLPLARALAEQHDGRLYLDVSRSDVNSFVVELPVGKQVLSSGAPSTISQDQEGDHPWDDAEQEYNDSRRDILIVEDNEDFRLYLAESLSSDFNVAVAANGKAAVEKIGKRKFDLIISDVMMPVMDGCKLCNFVKTTVEYSHIPVILMTAVAEMDTRLATLEVGADGYIEKPFPIELLLATVGNLFKNREIAYQQFAKSPLSHYYGTPNNRVDEELMSRLHTVMLERMSDSNLSINELSAALNISNSTLFRKVKTNTGLNINEYIRLSRLKMAAELLASGKYRVNEVADVVGFSSASYFSTNFQKQFNMTPSAFVKSLRSECGKQ